MREFQRGVNGVNKNVLLCNIDFRAYAEAASAVENSLTDGMLLSSVCLVTGVPASTVQNWIKRGYVANPDGKKYAPEQAADIILLNNMKNAVELSSASALLRQTKKKTGIGAVRLLSVLASSVIRAKRFNSTDSDSLRSVINMELRDAGITDRAVSQLLMITALSSLSADYKRLAEQEIKNI